MWLAVFIGAGDRFAIMRRGSWLKDWLQLAVLAVVVGGLASYLWWDYRRERQAIEGLKLANSTVVSQLSPSLPQELAGWLIKQDWLSKPFAEWLLLEVTEITVGNADFDDRGMAHLLRFRELRSLTVERTSITDAGLESLQPLVGLRDLFLDGTRITDAGLWSL